MAGPIRIQRRRTAGWHAPAGAIYVGRGSAWGNPFTFEGAIEHGYADDITGARRVVVDLFRAWLDGEDDTGADVYLAGQRVVSRRWMRAHLGELADWDLMCWCPAGQPCHADVLLHLANTVTPAGAVS